MRRIKRVELRQVDLEPKVVRTDAIQAFVRQETLLVTVIDDEGRAGTGYAYTIGTGGSSVIALLHDHLAPRLLGRDPIAVEAIWKDLFFHTHATAVGAITSLALSCIDTALWDWRARALGLPLWQLLGGAQARVPVYTTEGGWLHPDAAQLIEQTNAAKTAGFRGAKIKVGRPHVSEDIEGHVELARSTAIPVAIGESRITLRSFASTLHVARARSCRPASPASAGSRPGSRWRTLRRRSIFPSARIS